MSESDDKRVPENAAVPISTRLVPGSLIGTWTGEVGTGFLAEYRGEVGLYTAAHLPPGRQPMATPGWLGWAREFRAWLSPTHFQEVRIFTMGIPEQPTFKWLLNDAASGSVADMMALIGGGYASLVSSLQASYDVVDLDADAEVAIGDDVMCFGYPRLTGDNVSLRFSSSSVARGTVASLTDNMLKADMPSEPGFSGGPVFRSDGAFIGMTMGSTRTTTIERRWHG